jgi:hypothetical protein
VQSHLFQSNLTEKQLMTSSTKILELKLKRMYRVRITQILLMAITLYSPNDCNIVLKTSDFSKFFSQQFPSVVTMYKYLLHNTFYVLSFIERCSLYCDMFPFNRNIFRQYAYYFMKMIIPAKDPLFLWGLINCLYYKLFCHILFLL